MPGYGTFATADGDHVALGVVSEDHFWQPLCHELGLDDVADLGFADRAGRLDELQGRLADRIAGRARDELVEPLCSRWGCRWHRSSTATRWSSLEHFRAIDAVTSHPWADPATGFPFRLTHHPARRRRPPPSLDQDPDADWARR